MNNHLSAVYRMLSVKESYLLVCKHNSTYVMMFWCSQLLEIIILHPLDVCWLCYIDTKLLDRWALLQTSKWMYLIRCGLIDITGRLGKYMWKWMNREWIKWYWVSIHEDIYILTRWESTATFVPLWGGTKRWCFELHANMFILTMWTWCLVGIMFPILVQRVSLLIFQNWGTWMSVSNVMAIHPIFIEMFHCEPQMSMSTSWWC